MPGFIGENRLSELLTLIKNKFVQNDQIATSSTTGLVKPDGTTTTVDANGVISATAPVISSIDDIDDVSITSPTDGQILAYNGTDSEWVNADAPSSIPDGGTTGQVLVKKSNTDQDVEWSDVDGLPSGGTQGQVLTKQSSIDGDADWEDIDALPSGGTTGQVLAKHSNTDGDVEWITSESGHTIKDNGTAVADESSLNFTDFDISDDSTNEETDIKAHRLTSSEMADICSPLPGAPYRQIEYSLEEQVIGKWIDGKPLYMKTWTNLNVNTSGSDWVVLSGVSIPNLYKVIDCKLYAQGGNGEQIIMSVGEVNGSSSAGVSVTVTSSAFNRTIKVATIQYTKTTD